MQNNGTLIKSISWFVQFFFLMGGGFLSIVPKLKFKKDELKEKKLKTIEHIESYQTKKKQVLHYMVL